MRRAFATIVGTPGNDRIEGDAGRRRDRRARAATTGSPGSRVTTWSAGAGRRRPDVVRQGPRRAVGGAGDDFVGSFENPHARVRLGSGDDFASSQVGQDPGLVARRRARAGPPLPQPDPGAARRGTDAGFARPARGTARAAPRWSHGRRRRRRLGELDIPNSVRWDVRAAPTPTSGSSSRASSACGSARASGDDEILGTPQPDTIDGGAGEDTVTAYAGRDVCERVEHTRGCDVRPLEGGPELGRPLGHGGVQAPGPVGPVGVGGSGGVDVVRRQRAVRNRTCGCGQEGEIDVATSR